MLIGDIQKYKGQTYKCLAFEPYVRKDGKITTLAIIQSHCLACGVLFNFMAPVGRLHWPSRRCAKHKQPGVAAKRSVFG